LNEDTVSLYVLPLIVVVEISLQLHQSILLLNIVMLLIAEIRMRRRFIFLLALCKTSKPFGRLYREFKVGWMAIQTPSVQHPWPHTVEMLKCASGFLNSSFCQWRTCCIFVEDMAFYTCTLDMSNHLSLMGFDLPPWCPFKFF
jgi:hypothetical protein